MPDFVRWKMLRVEIAPPAGMENAGPTNAKREGEPYEAATLKASFPSVESFAQVLSDRNRKLLALIADAEPKSLTELAKMSGRAKPNLSRTLHTMERHGLVELHLEKSGTVRPRVSYHGIRLDLPLVARRLSAGRMT